MKNNSKVGFYVAYFIIILFVIAVIGGVVQAYNSHGSISDALTSDYYRAERSRIIRENKTYTVTKLNYEKDKAFSIDFDTYYVTIKDDDRNVQTIKVDSTTYYSLNVGDTVNYKGELVKTSSE